MPVKQEAKKEKRKDVKDFPAFMTLEPIKWNVIRMQIGCFCCCSLIIISVLFYMHWIIIMLIASFKGKGAFFFLFFWWVVFVCVLWNLRSRLENLLLCNFKGNVFYTYRCWIWDVLFYNLFIFLYLYIFFFHSKYAIWQTDVILMVSDFSDILVINWFYVIIVQVVAA